MASEEHLLKCGWVFSIQQYGPWKLIDTVQFESVECFWKAYEFMPKSSVAFRVSDNVTRSFFKHGVDRIRSICMRRDTIKSLEWEDPLNVGMFSFRLEDKDSRTVDDMYEQLLLLAVGETFGDGVRAIRIVDKGKKRSICTQYEIWCNGESKDVLNVLSGIYEKKVEWTAFE